MPTELEKLLTTEQAAALIEISPRTLERHRCDGTGPAYVKLSGARTGRVRYRQADVDQWLAARRRTATTGSPTASPAA